MEYIFIYLLQVFDNIELLKATSGVILGIGGAFYILGKCVYISDEKYYADLKNIYNKVLDKIFYILLSIFIFSMIVPTKQTMLLIGGTYLGKKAVKQVITDKKIEKINTIIELELDKRIKELKENQQQKNPSKIN